MMAKPAMPSQVEPASILWPRQCTAEEGGGSSGMVDPAEQMVLVSEMV